MRLARPFCVDPALTLSSRRVRPIVALVVSLCVPPPSVVTEPGPREPVALGNLKVLILIHIHVLHQRRWGHLSHNQ